MSGAHTTKADNIIKYILNAHGGKTNVALKLGDNQIIITADPLTTAFTTAPAYQGSELEKQLHNNQLLSSNGGTWTPYNNTSQNATNITLSCLTDDFNKFSSFSGTHNEWESIDSSFNYSSSNWGYFLSDQDATLVVKRSGQLIHIKDGDVKTYLEEYKNQNTQYTQGDIQLFCCFPKVHKIKVFNDTNLNEVMGELAKIHTKDQVSVVIATCNATGTQDKPITIGGNNTQQISLMPLIQKMLPTKSLKEKESNLSTTADPIVLSTDLDQDFIKKGTKEKKGGAGLGGIYRKKDNGKDYLIKQPSNSTKTDSFRCHQEILASRLALACGAAVPTMYEVQKKSTNQNANNIYVASEIIQHSADYNAAEIKQLKGNQKQNILSDCVVHAWLCNRDLVNSNGSNFVKDQDGRIYNVDLGQCLLNGFRGKTYKHTEPDTYNFNDDPVKLIPFIKTDDPNKFKQKDSANTLIETEVLNKNQLLNLSADNKQEEVSCYLQGVLKIDSLDDDQIKLIVNNSNDTEENKKTIIDGLKTRKQALIKYAEDTYGKFALQEEQAALYIQRIMHQAGVFPVMPSSIKGDSKVSWKAQFQNASKPEVKINDDNSFTLKFSDNTQATAAHTVFQQLNISQNISLQNQTIIINNLNFTEFNKLIIKHMVADRLQILLGSHDIENSEGYKTPYSPKDPYKGANNTALRPIIDINENSDKITISFDKDKIPKTKFIELLNTNYGLLDNDYENSTDDTKIIIKDHKKFTQLASTKLGARKTAVVSENEQGYILAGKLDPNKKAGKQGFATAGGNSDTPMNPKKAAAEEGNDEFGHTVNPSLLKPIGSTALDNTPNIFLAPEKATSTTSDKTIGYKEFQDTSIKWYSFEEFRKQHSTSKFDRSSIEYYLKHYQREIQKKLHELGLNNFIVICSKKPETLGMIYIKPSIPSKIDSNQLVTLEEESKLIEILTTHSIKYQAKDKKSKINTSGATLNRNIIEIDKDLNPAILLKKLSDISYTEKFTEKFKKFIEFKECFNKKYTENTNISYKQAAETEPTILGAIIATDSNNQLATIKQDSIECPITKNPEKKLINVQHQMFITFLEMHNYKDITIEANNFSYQDLKIILELIKHNTPKIEVKLQLPKEDQCINYDGQKYTIEEHQEIKQLIDVHNEDKKSNSFGM